jgi:hypothetical protein
MTRLFLFLLLLPLVSHAQKPSELFPLNLPACKIIFLEYDQLEIPEDMKRGYKKTYKLRNEAAEKANKELAKAAKDYPYEYTIASRDEVDKLSEQGYKYVLESPLMQGYNSGEDMVDEGGLSLIANLEIMDLHSATSYPIFSFGEDEVYDYKGIMKHFNKLLGKAFK